MSGKPLGLTVWLQTRVLPHREYRTSLPGCTKDEDQFFTPYLPTLETALQFSDGTWLRVTQPFNVDDKFLVWSQRVFTIVAALIMIGISLVLLVRVTRPLRRLSKAAELFGRQPEFTEPLPETGPQEVREAACSFNRMRERICGNLAARDRMLAAMAHNLRTPPTRLQLNGERVKDSALQNNIDDISGLISQSLDLTRSLDTEEAPIRMELTSFVQSIVDDNAETGTRVSMPRLKTATCRQSSCGCAGSASSAAWKISFPMPASTEAAPG